MTPLNGLLNMNSGFGQNCKFLFVTIFFLHFAFHLVFVVATTNLVFIAVTLNGLKFDMLMYPDHFRADKIWFIICWFSSFWQHFDLVKQVKFATSGHFFLRTQGRNGLNFGMLMYPDHLQNLLNFGHGLIHIYEYFPCSNWHELCSRNKSLNFSNTYCFLAKYAN